MKSIVRLQNPIQPYAWGSTRAIAALLGKKADDAHPQAELWMGAHPKAPSMVQCHRGQVSLLEVTAKDPQSVLGPTTVSRLGDRFPFLFKVLAADKPLSIQTHPDLDRARAGFARENRLGLAADAPERNYRDDNHKPECICALTPFWALNGFRSTAEIWDYAQMIAGPYGQWVASVMPDGPGDDSARPFFKALMSMPPGIMQQLLATTLTACRNRRGEDRVFKWVVRLHEHYPADSGILAPLFLNLVRLEPGMAMYLGAGELHAYLAGVGLELMANSDNVLRGGLTPKHVDVPELLKALTFKSGPPLFVEAQKRRKCEMVYQTPATEFELSMIRVSARAVYHSPRTRGVEILLCTEGAGRIQNIGSREVLWISKGDSLLVPAAVPGYHLEGLATVYKAAVPLKPI